MDEMVQNLFPGIAKGAQEKFLEHCRNYEHAALLEHTDDLLYPGVREVFEILSQKCKLYLVSNCQVGYIDIFMQKNELNKYITDTECFGNTLCDKGTNIKKVLERNHIRSAVYVGDTLGDHKATIEAGIPFVFAKYGFGKVEQCEHAIDCITEIIK